MNEQKIADLSTEVVTFVRKKVKGTDFTLGEVSSALGVAIGVFAQFDVCEQFGIPVKSQEEPEEEEEEEEEGEEFELRDLVEVFFAFDRLSSKYDDETVSLILNAGMKVPKWLKKEILERRG